MKNFILFICLVSVISCKQVKSKSQAPIKEDVAYFSYGAKITDDAVISKDDMFEKFKNLKKGDTINVKFASKINEVCKTKGCWMKLDLGKENESMVRFKDYGFFMPLDSDNKEVIVRGKAFVTETSVKELQHFAKDAGKSKEEIALITQPKFTYAFEADGVLMKK